MRTGSCLFLAGNGILCTWNVIHQQKIIENENTIKI